VTDTDPPDKVGDIPTPTDGPVKVPLTDTIDHLLCNRPDAEQKTGDADQEADTPEPGRRRFDRPYNIFRDLVIILLTYNQRCSCL